VVKVRLGFALHILSWFHTYISYMCSSTVYIYFSSWLLNGIPTSTSCHLLWVLLWKWPLVSSFSDFVFHRLVRKLSSFSVILYKNLSSFWINNSWNFIYDLQHCEVFAVRQPLTFFDYNKISSCTFIIFIMSKIYFSFIEELKSKHKQRE